MSKIDLTKKTFPQALQLKHSHEFPNIYFKILTLNIMLFDGLKNTSLTNWRHFKYMRPQHN